MAGYLYLEPMFKTPSIELSLPRWDPLSTNRHPPLTGGDSTTPGFENHVKLMGVQFGLAVAVEKEPITEEDRKMPPPGRRIPDPDQKYWLVGGAPALDPVVVTKRMDRSSVAMLEAAARVIPLGGLVTLTSAEKEQEVPYLVVFLHGVLLSRAGVDWQGDDKRPLERWALHYELIQWSFRPRASADELFLTWSVIREQQMISANPLIYTPQTG
jgi:type VI protein secretion system component Hcp